MLVIAKSVFGIGGIGFPIISLTLLALGVSLCQYLVSAAGKGQYAGIINAVGLFIAIVILATSALAALMAVAKPMGLG